MPAKRTSAQRAAALKRRKPCNPRTSAGRRRVSCPKPQAGKTLYAGKMRTVYKDAKGRKYVNTKSKTTGKMTRRLLKK